MTSADTTQTKFSKGHNIDQNVDQSEIAKFEKMASTWWDLEGKFKPLHDLNPLRANYIDEKAQVAQKRVVDVGCGGGILTEALAQRGAEVVGIDMGDAPLQVAKLHALESNLEIEYKKNTAEDFAKEQAESFDVVCCMEMLEHVPNPASVIQACADLTKPGGDIFFSTINRNPKSYIFAILGAEYILNLLPKGTHEYAKFIRPSELAKDIRKAKLELQDIKGITYNPLTKIYKLSSKDVDVNYLVHTKKPQ